MQEPASEPGGDMKRSAVPGGGGGSGVIAVFMSVWISVADSARLYKRTSSIVPLNHSFAYTALPPIRKAPGEVATTEFLLRLPTCVPLTYTRIVEPLNVRARWLQTFSASRVFVRTISCRPRR